MKKILLPFYCLFLVVFLACTPDSDDLEPMPVPSTPGTLTPPQTIGQWKLTKIMWRSQIAGQPSTNYPLPYEETLQFQADSTFIRYRNGVKATGSFSIKSFSKEKGLSLVATLDDPSVAFYTVGSMNFSYSPGMTLWNEEADYLLLDASSHDGPTLYYQKLKE